MSEVLGNGTEGNQEGEIRALDVDPRGRAEKGVDGDLLGRWVREDGDLGELLGVGTVGVERVFGELAGLVLGDVGQEGLEGVNEWLGEVLRAVL